MGWGQIFLHIQHQHLGLMSPLPITSYTTLITLLLANLPKKVWPPLIYKNSQQLFEAASQNGSAQVLGKPALEPDSHCCFSLMPDYGDAWESSLPPSQSTGKVPALLTPGLQLGNSSA